MNLTHRPLAGLAALLFLSTLVAGCGAGGNDALAEPDVHHPLSSKLLGVQKHFEGIDGQDADSMRSFLRYADPDAAPFEVRRICGIAGRALAGAEPEVVAGFVAGAADHLYDDFFKAWDVERRSRIAGSLPSELAGGEVARLRMEAVLRRGGAVYEGTLREALSMVSFLETMAPWPLDPDTVLDPAAESPADWVAAGEILARDAFVPGKADPARAVAVYREGLAKWPGDPLLVAGLASLLVELGDGTADDAESFLKRAASLDPQNAAWPCLRAARALRVGRDPEALAALREMKGRPVLTFRSLDRARCVAKRLEELGYGPIRSRIAAYRATSVACWLEVKDLANRAIQRSFEYGSTGQKVDQRLVLELPALLDEQVRNAPRTLFADELKGVIVAAGLRRLAEFTARTSPGLAREHYDRAAKELARSREIREAAEKFSGQEAWASYYECLGEERFLDYLDHVLYGNEADFLLRAAQAGDFRATLEFATDEFPFE